MTPCFISPPEDFEGDLGHDCGHVVVPENAARPDGPKVRLSFLRCHAETPSEAAPVFMLAGGPGATQLDPTWFLFFGPEFLGGILETRDVILLDQRGTRYTEPLLDCPEYGTLGWRRYAEGLDEDRLETAFEEALTQCVERVRAAGVDLSTYNSVVIASDVDATRRALG